MATYRGPGGSGDATNDAANEAVVAQGYAIQAENFKNQASVSANSAASSASTASTANSNAQTAKTAAEAAQAAAEDARDASLNFADELIVQATTGAAGSEASVTYTSGTTTMAFTIPRGDTGATGPTGPTGATGPAGADGVGVPAGGTTGQYLIKSSNTNYATTWSTLDLSGYLTSSTAASTYVALAGSYSNPTWITSLAGSKITGTLDGGTY